jgi:hypothetical protein
LRRSNRPMVLSCLLRRDLPRPSRSTG